MRKIAIFIACIALLFIAGQAMAFGNKGLGTSETVVTKGIPIQSVVVFNDEYIPVGTKSTDWSDPVYIGDLSFSNSSTYNKATILLGVAHANTATTAAVAGITAVYRMCYDKDGFACVEPSIPGTNGLFSSSSSDGFDPDEGHNNSLSGYVTPSTGQLAGPYCLTQTKYVTIDVDKAPYVQFQFHSDDVAKFIHFDAWVAGGGM